MRVAVFGAGRIGSIHAENLAATGRVDELIVADEDFERAARVAQRVGATAAAPDAAWESEIDAVVIATPTRTHAEFVDRCINQGLPVFCEKPLTEEYADTLALVARVEQTGTRLQVGFNRRFDPPHAELRRLIRDGALGTVYAIRIASHDHDPAPESYIATSGGIFRDLLIHDFDALRWIAGQEVSSVYAAGAIRRFDYVGKYGDVDTAALVMVLEDGTLVSVTAGRENGRGEDNRLEVVGSADCVALGVGPQTPIRSLEPDAEEPDVEPYMDGFVRYAEAYRAELQHFLSLAVGEAADVCTARDGLAAVTIAVAAEMSLSQGRRVELSEVT